MSNRKQVFGIVFGLIMLMTGYFFGWSKGYYAGLNVDDRNEMEHYQH